MTPFLACLPARVNYDIVPLLPNRRGWTRPSNTLLLYCSSYAKSPGYLFWRLRNSHRISVGSTVFSTASPRLLKQHVSAYPFGHVPVCAMETLRFALVYVGAVNFYYCKVGDVLPNMVSFATCYYLFVSTAVVRWCSVLLISDDVRWNLKKKEPKKATNARSQWHSIASNCSI